MRQHVKSVSLNLLFCVSILLIILTSTSFKAKNFSDINLLVDESITSPIRKLVRLYVNSNYVSVAVQLSQYNSMLNLNTKNTDIIITADDSTILFLQANNLVEKKISYVADSKLVLASNIIQHDTNVEFSDFVKEISKRSAIVLSDPNTNLSGYLGKQILTKLGVENFIFVKDTQKVVELVQKGGGIGILPTTSEHNFRFVSEVPGDLYEPIKYRALVFKGRLSENVTSFLKFILLNDGILKKYNRL